MNFDILLISTGEWAHVLKDSVQLLHKKELPLQSLAIGVSDQWEDAKSKIQASVRAAKEKKGVLVLVDVAGATPYNIAHELRESGQNLEVIGGVNVPMVVKAVQIAGEKRLSEAASFLEEYGRSHIKRDQSGAKTE